MKYKNAVIGLVVVLAAVTGCDSQSAQPVTKTEEVIVPPSASASTDLPSTSSTPSTSPKTSTSKTSTSPKASTSSPATPTSVAPVSKIPMRKLAAGEKAPQFIIFSFDGVGSHAKWQEFMTAAAKNDAHFNGFLTGLYLLTDDNADKYSPPQHKAGRSEVGFGGDAAEVATRIEDLNKAMAAGHEIGTHYNGHFCGTDGGADSWSAADWDSDLGQFMGFVKNYRQNNPGITLPELTLKTTDIKGGRTQCLEGKADALFPVWNKYGFTYDSSLNDPRGGVNWPLKRGGLWEFYMPCVYTPAFNAKRCTVNMDYNLWVRFNEGKNQPETAPELREKVYQNYTYLYDQTFNGNRAPLLIANHFNNWNGNSFNPATLKFMENYCGKPETVCATYSEVVAWLNLQDPAVLTTLQNRSAAAATRLGS